MQMLYDFTGGPTKWTGGKVYNAATAAPIRARSP
jgi:hypothetical protein